MRSFGFLVLKKEKWGKESEGRNEMVPPDPPFSLLIYLLLFIMVLLLTFL